MWIIYKHENLITHQVYIGITNQDPEQRWGKHGINYKRQLKFFDAILEYGWRNFSHIILYSNILTEQEAKIIETQLIKKYDSINNGYNSCYSINLNDYPLTEYVDIITKKIYYNQKDIAQDLKVSESAISKYLSRPEQISCQNHIILEKYKYDKLTKQELNDLQKKITSYKIKCLETNEIFDDAEIAGKKYSNKKGAKSYILKACKEGSTAYKKHWQFIF